MKEYSVIYERRETCWGARVPSLPGCTSIGDTLEETKRNIQEAIEIHIAGSRHVDDVVDSANASKGFSLSAEP